MSQWTPAEAEHCGLETGKVGPDIWVDAEAELYIKKWTLMEWMKLMTVEYSDEVGDSNAVSCRWMWAESSLVVLMAR